MIRQVPGDADLQRFLDAQDEGGAYETALAELRAGRKTSHWIWFVFPQIDGLGSSPMARAYAIRSLEEARSYAAHPELGARLRRCAATLLEHAGSDPAAILGDVDALKLRSSMTLFGRAAPEEPLFGRVLDAFYGGEEDPGTVRRI